MAVIMPFSKEKNNLNTDTLLVENWGKVTNSRNVDWKKDSRNNIAIIAVASFIQ